MRQRGSVFLLTLAVLVALVLLVTAVAVGNREFTRGQGTRMTDRRADFMVEAGVQRAVAEIASQNPGRATKNDRWASLGDGGDTLFTLGTDGFRLQILDASALVDLNTADEEQLKKLKLSPEQTDAILDWREEKPSPRALGGKDEYYHRLKNPYNAKLKPFDSPDELELVKGFTPEAVAGLPMLGVNAVSGDLNPDGEAKLDLKEATLPQLLEIGVPQDLAQAILQQRGGWQKLGDALKIQNMTKEAARTLADNTTIGKDTQRKGLINVNTASAAVLESVKGLEPETVSAIVSRQGAGYRSLGELLDVPGIELPLFADIVDRLCISSRSFIVRVVGVAGRTLAAAEGQLTLGDKGGVTISRLQPVPPVPAMQRWGWPETPSRRERVGGDS